MNVDTIFYALGIFCYFAVLFRFKENARRYEEYANLCKKKQAFSNHIVEQQRREYLAQKSQERKRLNQPDYKSMASTVERLSELSDQEVMRKSRVAGTFSRG